MLLAERHSQLVADFRPAAALNAVTCQIIVNGSATSMRRSTKVRPAVKSPQ